jgi:hypothetical protein
MGTVIQVSTRKIREFSSAELETHSDPNIISILSLGAAQLVEAASLLSKQFDRIENVIDKIIDAETRARLTHSTKMNRDTLVKSTLDLSQQVQNIASAIAVLR